MTGSLYDLIQFIKLMSVLSMMCSLMNYIVHFTCMMTFCLTLYFNPCILYKFYFYYNFFVSSFNLLDSGLLINFFYLFYTVVSFVFVVFFILVKFIWLFLILTIVIATMTLMERKLLALTQSRVGPNYIGYKGRLQFIADAVKMLVKNMAVLSKVNKLLFMVVPALLCGLMYVLWCNLVWGSSLAFFEMEYNLMLIGVLSGMNSMLLVLVGFLTNNKYSIMSSSRIVVIGLTVEILLTLLFVFFVLVCESLSLSNVINMQDRLLFGIFFVLPLAPVLLLLFCAEVSSVPFDFAEAESELMAGYTTEYGGFYFALFYLGEYFHLFCFSALFVLTLFGG